MTVLFSITKDLKIPYNGRNRTRPPTLEIYKDIIKKRKELERQQYAQEEDGYDNEEQEEIFVDDDEAQMELQQLLSQRGWESLFGSEEAIFFGGTDLVLDGDLTACKSALEHSYGIGLSQVDSKSLLAGAGTFRLHQLEIYLVTASGGFEYPLPEMSDGEDQNNF